MFAINMAREPGCYPLCERDSLTLLFPQYPPPNGKPPRGVPIGHKQFSAPQKILETNGDTLPLGQVLLDDFPSTLDRLTRLDTRCYSEFLIAVSTGT